MESHYIINRICMMPQLKLLILRLEGFCWYLGWFLEAQFHFKPTAEFDLFEIWGEPCTGQYSVMVTIALEVDLRRVRSHWQPRFHLFSSFWRVHKPPFYSKVYQTQVSPVLNTWTRKQISGLFLWLKITAVIHFPFAGKGSLKYSFRLELTRLPFPI